MKRYSLNLTLAALLALPLATTGCSQGQSPTEPALDLESPALSSMADESRGSGGDDNRDDRAGDDRSGKGRGGDDKADDNNNNRRRRGRNGRNGGDDRQRPQAPRAGQEFEGAVTAVDAGAGTLTVGRTRIIVNGQTQWNARGDLLSLSEVAGAFRAGDAPRVEGRGTRQANGAILALTIKAEVDN